jgi:hypothetical protein
MTNWNVDAIKWPIKRVVMGYKPIPFDNLVKCRVGLTKALMATESRLENHRLLNIRNDIDKIIDGL